MTTITGTKYSRFNSKELSRAIKELDPKNFIIYLIIVNLILEFNDKNKVRRLSHLNLIKALPFSFSVQSLMKSIKVLKNNNFINVEKCKETKHNIYSQSIQKDISKTGYTKIDQNVFSKTFIKIERPFIMKLFLVVYIGKLCFSSKQNSFYVKKLSDFTLIMGKTPTKSRKRKVSEGLKKLRRINCIEYESIRTSQYSELKIYILKVQNEIIKNMNKALSSSPMIQLSNKKNSLNIFKNICNKDENKPNKMNELKPFNTPQVKVLSTSGESFKYLINIKKKNLNKNQNLSKSNQNIIHKPKINFSSEKISKDDILILQNFNFMGMNQNKNPMTELSIYNVFRNTNLTLKQIQNSIIRFVEICEVRYSSHKILDKTAFIINHMLNYGEYFPNKKKQKNTYPKFNYCGLDKLSNPFSQKSLNRIVKTNKSTLDIERIQCSVRRFSEYINSKYYQNEFKNPAGFLTNHLVEFGEYVPPEEFLTNNHKDQNRINISDLNEVFIEAKKCTLVDQKVKQPPKKTIQSKKEETTEEIKKGILLFQETCKFLDESIEKDKFKKQPRQSIARSIKQKNSKFTFSLENYSKRKTSEHLEVVLAREVLINTFKKEKLPYGTIQQLSERYLTHAVSLMRKGIEVTTQNLGKEALQFREILCV